MREPIVLKTNLGKAVQKSRISALCALLWACGGSSPDSATATTTTQPSAATGAAAGSTASTPTANSAAGNKSSTTSAGRGATATPGSAGTSAPQTSGAPSAGAAAPSGPVMVGPIPDLTPVPGTCKPGSNTLDFETAEFCVSLNKSSHTIASLSPKADPSFDFAPSDRLSMRSQPGFMHLGDITLRWRMGDSGAWQNATTGASRANVSALPASGEVLAAADLGAALPGSLPLNVKRTWSNHGGRLVMRFDITNRAMSPVQLGALGMPMVFNNILTDRTLEQAHTGCSFADPYIGRDAGYVQVTRLNGRGPTLLVLPDAHTPFEAYSPLLPPKPAANEPTAVFTDATPRSNTFEGFYEWLVHSSAYAEQEWSKAQPWNSASSATLAPGETRSYALQFVLAPNVRGVEKTLAQNQRPVAVGVPGYILPMDLEGKLILSYPWPVKSTQVEPEGALELTPGPPTPGGQLSYDVLGKTWGRARLTVTYDNDVVQTIHYYVTKPSSQAVSDLGTFLTTKAWFVADKDPFGRSPSVMTYDHELDQIVTQAKQAWVSGLGDDGGATWLAGAMKLFGQPEPAQAAKYEQFIDGAIWGGLQYKDGAQQYGVKRALFYYDPSAMPGYYSNQVQWVDPSTGQTYWGAWDRAHTLEVPRSYNYPHVTALYWSMYRLARNYQGLTSAHPWNWYLTQAYQTAVAMTTVGNQYAKYGLMDGTVFVELLQDLKREGLTQQATDLENRMHMRETTWRAEAYPFGSEMPWDSTGQEEVYAWTHYFGDVDKAKTCIDAITGYMPAIPHWGYNGCARRYWDFKYGGSKTDRLERMIHHYGSSLNALPVLSEYRDHPDDLYLLRIGYAGMMGSLSAIDQDGFPSMAFHAFPDSLRWDPISGDYGLNFFGHAEGAATYLIDDPALGWQAFGGNVRVTGTLVSLTPLDSLRRRIYVAPAGLWLTLDAGRFEALSFDTQTRALRVTLSAADSFTPAARLRIEQPGAGKGMGSVAPTETWIRERDAFVVPLEAAPKTIDLH